MADGNLDAMAVRSRLAFLSKQYLALIPGSVNLKFPIMDVLFDHVVGLF